MPTAELVASGLPTYTFAPTTRDHLGNWRTTYLLVLALHSRLTVYHRVHHAIADLLTHGTTSHLDLASR